MPFEYSLREGEYTIESVWKEIPAPYIHITARSTYISQAIQDKGILQIRDYLVRLSFSPGRQEIVHGKFLLQWFSVFPLILRLLLLKKYVCRKWTHLCLCLANHVYRKIELSPNGTLEHLFFLSGSVEIRSEFHCKAPTGYQYEGTRISDRSKPHTRRSRKGNGGPRWYECILYARRKKRLLISIFSCRVQI